MRPRFSTHFSVSRMKKVQISTCILIGALLLILVCVQTFLKMHRQLLTEEATYKEVFKNWPKCEQNTSAASIPGFSSLPYHIQNFLDYRHCRQFPMLLDIPDKCGGPNKSSDVFLLLVVKSLPGSHKQREALRQTWAREHKGLGIRRIFITGTSGSGMEKMRLNKLLRKEQNKNSDILQWTFDESFFNLTLKQILFFEWMERNCPSARFLFNGDDDVFVNMDGMVEYLQDLPENDGSGHLYTGFVFKDTGPVRDKGSKYYVPKLIDESDTYTPYCGGGGYLLSGYTAMVIYSMSRSIDVHPIDDVYIGMCVGKAGLLPTFHMGVKTLGLSNNAVQIIDEQDPCYMKGLLLLHRFIPAQIYLMWHKINGPHLRCGKQIWREVENV